MQVNQYTIDSEQKAAQKFDPGTIRLLSNTSKENRMGNPVSYQIIPYAGGTHPAATGAKFAPDEWIYHRLSFMDKQLWVTRYHPTERYPEGKYPNRSAHDTGLGQYAKDDESLTNHDDVVWITTGTTHVRAPKSGRSCRPSGRTRCSSRGTSLTKPLLWAKRKSNLNRR